MTEFSQEGRRQLPASDLPSAAPEQGPRIADLLALIDAEIEHARASLSRSGWNVWALLIASGTVLLLLIDTWERSRVSLPRAAVLFIAVTMVVELLMPPVADRSNASPVGHGRFRLGTFLGLRPIAVLAMAVRCVLVAAAAFVGRSALPLYGVVAIIALYLGSALLITLVAAFVSRGHPVQPGGGNRITTVFRIAYLGLAITSVVALSSRIQLAPPGTPNPELRVAGFAAVGLQLLLYLVAERNREPLLDSLLQLRREFALGDVDHAAAWHRARVALLGMGIADWIQPDVSAMLSDYDQLLASERAAGQLAESTNSELARLGTETPNGERARALAKTVRAGLVPIERLVGDALSASRRIRDVRVKIAGRIGYAEGGGIGGPDPSMLQALDWLNDDAIRREVQLSHQFDQYKAGIEHELRKLGFGD